MDGTNCSVSFVVNETAEQRTVAEIHEEMQKLEATITETERVIKGVQKMQDIYKLQKDVKNTKLVEVSLLVRVLLNIYKNL